MVFPRERRAGVIQKTTGMFKPRSVGEGSQTGSAEICLSMELKEK